MFCASSRFCGANAYFEILGPDWEFGRFYHHVIVGLPATTKFLFDRVNLDIKIHPEVRYLDNFVQLASTWLMDLAL
jgi:hypothetical protein